MTRKIGVWIHIPKLTLELCNDQFLKLIGFSLGTMLKINKLASIHDRGRFTRICTELNLGEQLSSHVVIRGAKFPLECESLHSICFRCMQYGYKKDQLGIS